MNDDLKKSVEWFYDNWNKRHKMCKHSIIEAEKKIAYWEELKEKIIQPIFEDVAKNITKKHISQFGGIDLDERYEDSVIYSDTLKGYKGLNFALLKLPERPLERIAHIQRLNESVLVCEEEQGGYLFISQAMDGSIAIIVRPSVIGITNSPSKIDKDNFLVLKHFPFPTKIEEKDIKDAVIFMLNYSLVTSFVFSQKFKFTNWFCLCDSEVRFKLKLLYYLFNSWCLSSKNKEIQILKLAIRPLFLLAKSITQT